MEVNSVLVFNAHPPTHFLSFFLGINMLITYLRSKSIVRLWCTSFEQTCVFYDDVTCRYVEKDQ